MADYTTSKSTGGGSIGLFVAAGVVVLIVLYAIYAGGGDGTTVDPASLAVPDAAAPAAADTTAPAETGAETAPITNP